MLAVQILWRSSKLFSPLKSNFEKGLNSNNPTFFFVFLVSFSTDGYQF